MGTNRGGGRLTTGLVAVLVMAGCTGGCTSGAVPKADPPATPMTSTTSAMPSTPVPTAPPALAPPPPTPAPTLAADPYAGKVVITLADEGLRVRTRPGVDDDRTKLDPLLPLGTRLYVLGGPVEASRYAWYEVAPFDPGNLPTGWIASVGRDGTPWIEPATGDCPPVPPDLASLAALPPGVGPACFSRLPITVRARLLGCNCDMDGSWYTPSWFFLGSGSPVLLVDPASSRVPADMDDWFTLSLDPDGDAPADLPLGKVVEVTGMFDHPAAEGCTRTEMDGEPVPGAGCRVVFAVTRLQVVDR